MISGSSFGWCFKIVACNDDFELNVGAQVVWRQKKDEGNIYGLAFNRIDQSAQDGLDQYINKNFRDLIVTEEEWVAAVPK